MSIESLGARTTSAVEPRRTPEAYAAAIREAQDRFRTWHDKCDNIDRQYADLKHLASHSRADRELQLFWSNIETMAQAVYSRPPEPVVAPKFRDRRALPREASTVLERAIRSSFDDNRVHDVLSLVRDDTVINGRGVAWVRWAPDDDGGRVIVEHLDRRDFCHDPGRKWHEVEWVARRAYLTREQVLMRFRSRPDEAQAAEYEAVGAELPDELKSPMERTGAQFERLQFKSQDDFKMATGQDKVAVWEVWDRAEDAVVWLAEGYDEAFLDARRPHLRLEGFFPCPRPAYTTAQRNTLLPVPDFVYYKDQLEEINTLTARIASLSEALKMRGLVPGGAGDLSEAVRRAMAQTDDNAVIVPVAEFAAFGGGSLKDSIVWLPVREVAETVANLVQLRRQLIDDVYQITGLADIMRGASDARETAAAQRIKSQWGSLRLQARQAEMVRVAADLSRIVGEILAENAGPQTMALLSQPKLPSRADVQREQQGIIRQIAELQRQASSVMADPATMDAAQEAPEQAQQAVQQYQQQMAGLREQLQETRERVTFEGVLEFLRQERVRPFVLDIETDSTIQPDEDAEKQRRLEYMQTINGFLAQAVPAMGTAPQLGDFIAQSLQFVASGFRAGRELEGTIDELAEKIREYASQAPAPGTPPPQEQAEMQLKQREQQLEEAEAQHRMQLEQMRLALEQTKTTAEVRKIEAEISAMGRDDGGSAAD